METFQFSSVTQSCPTLYNPMDCSMSGFPVHHQLPELTQTHVHRVRDAIQPSHPLSSPSPPAFNLSQHQGLFKRLSSLHQVAKYCCFSFRISPSNQYSGQISFRMDWLDLLAVQGTLQDSSPTTQFKSINSSALSFLYSPTLTSIHDSWKTIALTRWIFASKVMSLSNMLSRLLIAFLPRSSSVQFSQSVVSESLQPHKPQHARSPCTSPSPGVYPNSCPLSR